MENEEIEQNEYKDNSQVLPNGKSVDVFNALNLFCESLGELYKNQGYNPFDKDFVLTDEFTKEILERKLNEGEIIPADFLEFSNKQVSKHFSTALNNNTALIELLSNEEKVTTDANMIKQVKNCILFLKNRNELLKMDILKLKNKDANALKMYIEMYGIDTQLSELLSETFNEKANLQLVISQMLNLCKTRTLPNKIKNIKNKLENEMENTNTNDYVYIINEELANTQNLENELQTQEINTELNKQVEENQEQLEQQQEQKQEHEQEQEELNNDDFAQQDDLER